MPKAISIIAVALFIILGLGFFVWYNGQNNPQPQMEAPKKSEAAITYVAIGDSYTIGLGVGEDGRWPNVLVKHLKEAGVDIDLIANPSVSGYEVQDAISRELPLVQRVKPDFVTVLIGANDNFRQKEVTLFEQDLKELLDKLQLMLSNPKNIVLVTIPDYSKSPSASEYQTEGISQSIETYNQVVKDEARERDLKVADIFPISQTMTGEEDYISDGLHPSAQGYIKWEKVIFPVVWELLKGS